MLMFSRGQTNLADLKNGVIPMGTGVSLCLKLKLVIEILTILKDKSNKAVFHQIVYGFL